MSAETGCRFQRSASDGEFLCTPADDDDVPHSEKLLRDKKIRGQINLILKYTFLTVKIDFAVFDHIL